MEAKGEGPKGGVGIVRDDRISLNPLFESIQKIEEYTNEDYQSFFESSFRQDAVIRNLGVRRRSGQEYIRDIEKSTPWYPVAPYCRITGSLDPPLYGRGYSGRMEEYRERYPGLKSGYPQDRR